MASCHWVDELFPPKFNLNSSFDFDEEKSERSYPTKVRDVQKIYEDVYLSTVSPGKGRELDTSLKLFIKQKESVGKEVEIFDRLELKAEPNHAEKRTENATGGVKCIWNAEELVVLRKSLKRSRLNNIRLSVMTRSLQKDCEHLRKTCHGQAREILMLKEKYGNVRKRNKRMKIVCIAFKEDSQKYNADLEECERLLQEAVNDKNNSELKLLQVNKELEYTHKMCEKLSLELEKEKMLKDRFLKNQKDALELDRAREIYKLTNNLKQTKLELEKEKNDHAINKKALEHLRLHFASNMA